MGTTKAKKEVTDRKEGNDNSFFMIYFLLTKKKFTFVGE